MVKMLAKKKSRREEPSQLEGPTCGESREGNWEGRRFGGLYTGYSFHVVELSDI